MSKTKEVKRKSAVPEPLVPLIISVPLFFAVCLLVSETAKAAAIVLGIAAAAVSLIFMRRLRARITPPVIALALLVMMNGVSTQYAIAGKFALYEFLKVFSSACLCLILLTAAPGSGERAARWLSTVFEGAAAISALVSVDLISTRLISGAVTGLLGTLSAVYAEPAGIEAGTRIISLFEHPNIFAGKTGIGVILALALMLSSESKGERAVHVVLLFTCAFAFMLAFSMGATLALALSALILLIIIPAKSRPELLIAGITALVIALVLAFLVSQTSFEVWSGFDPVPLLCLIAGAAAFAALDRFVLSRVYVVKALGGRTIPVIAAALAALAAVYALLGWNLTKSADLAPGESLRRSSYPAGGAYTLSVSADSEVEVEILSQNREETMMHSSTLLYNGAADGAEFTVPEGSEVVHFRFTAPSGAKIEAASYSGGGKTEKIALDYVLLPGFISNRLQGLRANENAIQRFVFFSDGLKLFSRSPVFGLGMGAFENAVKSVQSFFYETKYVHNHYIQTLVEGGTVGLALFIGVFAASFWAIAAKIRREKKSSAYLSGLAACLAFMAAHAAVEVVFSGYPYLPFAFGAFTAAGLAVTAEPKEESAGVRKAKTAGIAVFCALTALFTAAVTANVIASDETDRDLSLPTLERAAAIDRFEWPDYLLTYVYTASRQEVSAEALAKAHEYADRLAGTESNSIPAILADCRFRWGERDEAFGMLEKYAAYTASDSRSWSYAFALLEEFDDGSPEFGEEARRLYGMMEDWNGRNIGHIELDESARSYLERYL